MSTDGVLTPPRELAPEIHGRVVDGKLVVVTSLYPRANRGPGAGANVHVYDPETDSWREVPGADAPPPELARTITRSGFFDGRYLLNAFDLDGAQHYASLDPLTGEWTLVDPEMPPAQQYATPNPTAVDGELYGRLLVWDDTRYVGPAILHPLPDADEREWQLALTDGLHFAWGGRTRRCNLVPMCDPAGFLYQDPPRVPYFDQLVHGDGQVFDGMTGTASIPGASASAARALSSRAQ